MELVLRDLGLNGWGSRIVNSFWIQWEPVSGLLCFKASLSCRTVVERIV